MQPQFKQEGSHLVENVIRGGYLSSDALLIMKAKKSSDWENNEANLKSQMEE